MKKSKKVLLDSIIHQWPFAICVSHPDPSMQMMIERYERYHLWLAKLMGKDPESFSLEDAQVLSIIYA